MQGVKENNSRALKIMAICRQVMQGGHLPECCLLVVRKDGGGGGEGKYGVPHL